MLGEAISHYRIVHQLGKGGMGVVYEAEDTRLGRKVALKFLPEHRYDDPNSLERLHREARAASTLNHPNICTVYDIGEHSGRPFIVMERLNGRVLSDLIQSRDLPITSAVDFAIQIADALETAHKHDIVHRDIKPANLFVTERGEIKILDFGLAKITRARQPASQMLTAAATEEAFITSPGSAVGTAVYMSPEQARGEEVDARSDLFSLGAVMYEMVTGGLPFSGTTSAVIFDAILNREPVPPSRLNPLVSPELERIITKLLEKDRDLRYQSASELKADLKRLRRDTQTTSGKTQAAPASLAARSGRTRLIVAAVVVVAAAAAGWFWSHRAPRVAPPSQWVALTDFTDSAVQPAISPDGRMLAFIRGIDPFLTVGELYVKLLPDGEPVQLTHDTRLKLAPAFTPDGSKVAYTGIDENSSWNTYVVPVLGGEPQMLLPNTEALRWIPQKRILFSEIKQGLHMVLVTATESKTGTRDIYAPPTDRGMAHHSALSPDTKQVLLTEMGSSGEWLRCRMVPFDGSSQGVQVGPPGSRCLGAAWSLDGRWMYLNLDAGDGFHLWRQRSPNAKPEQITFGPTEQRGITLSPSGDAIITSVGNSRSTVRVHLRSGEEREVSTQGNTFAPRFSPDGSKLYFLRSVLAPSSVGVVSSGSFRLLMLDMDSFRTEDLFPDLLISDYDISPNGQRVVFSAPDERGILRVWVAKLDRRSPPQLVTSSLEIDEPAFASDDELYVRVLDKDAHRLRRVRLDGSGARDLFPILEFNGTSRDRKWAIVTESVSTENPTARIVARQVDGPTSVTVCRGCTVRWSADEKLMYLDFFFGTALTRAGQDVVVPTLSGQLFPHRPQDGVTLDTALKLPGARRSDVFPQPSTVPGVFAYATLTVQRNIYRIPLQ